jgi:hypothetical protein
MDRLLATEGNLTRFVVLAVSVIIFLLLRDWIQRLIDRVFHRELYDSATVVSDFEENLAGIYRLDELKQKIVQGIDEIFHFKSFIFILKRHELTYETAFAYGIDDPGIGKEFGINTELEEKLVKSKVFSPGELDQKPSCLKIAGGELIVPLLSGQQSAGFFICGQKKSERIYSRQDIRVLTLLARRVVALLLSITDNGKGFNQSKHGSGGNGLLNMKKRAEELGGTFDIQSSPGNGTRIVFDIRLQ